MTVTGGIALHVSFGLDTLVSSVNTSIPAPSALMLPVPWRSGL